MLITAGVVDAVDADKVGISLFASPMPSDVPAPALRRACQG